MSTPTQPMPGTDVRAEITRFVAAVEQALDDLPRDDAAELTDGLEADLIEAWAAEGVRPGERFGSPASYAEELRAAAGLPPRMRSGINAPAAMRVQWQHDRERILAGLRTRPWWPAAVELGVQLRPAWWALRGVVLIGLVGWVLAVYLGVIPFVLLVLLMLPAAVWGAVVSMRKGAADRAPTPRARGWLRVANGVSVGALVISTLGLLGSLGGGSSTYYDDSPYLPTGLSSGGEPVTNVFAYDAEGKPVTRVRLYDQAGRPLNIDESARDGWDDGTGDGGQLRSDVGDAPQEWNLFPLVKQTEQLIIETDAEGMDLVRKAQDPVAPPYAQLPALPSSSVTSPSPSPAPEKTPAGS